MSNKSLFILLLFIPVILFAQKKEELQIEKSKDSTIQHKVMLIPFDPKYYLSDAENEIAEQTKKEPPQIRARFRSSMDLFIERSIKHTKTPCISLLQDTSSAAKITLQKIYAQTGYQYEKTIPVNAEKVKSVSTKKSSDKELKDSKTAPQYISEPHNEKYMNVVLHQKNLT